MKKESIYIFDAYGTLFDVDSACRSLSKKLGSNWINFSTLWRQKQLEYSWLRNSMQSYENFWKITQNALDYALDSLKIKDKNLRSELLDLYFKIESYKEVNKFLINVKRNNIKTCILSNGNYEMLNSAVKNAKLDLLIDKILSVENCKVYKPSKEVYQLVLDEFNQEKDKYIFFSSNCWDIHGASNFGLKTVWVNRINKIDDNLPGKPDFIINKLNDHKINKI